MKLGWTAALLVLLAGCAPASRAVRLDTGQADTLLFTPRSGAAPVTLNGEAFKDMADPHAMVAAVLWTWTTYMVLLSILDVTVSKGLAAVMTAALISYVGIPSTTSTV
jgi:hypothetical protein